MRFSILYSFRLFKSLTFIKVWNAFLLFSQYYFSILRKKPVISAKPASISIEPTNICNLHCPECLTGNGTLLRRKGLIEQADFNKIIDETYKKLCYLLLYFQGEPLLHPQFCDFVYYAKSKGIFVATSTNGHFLSEANARAIVQSKLDFLIISMDGVTPESYQKYRKGGDLTQVIEGIKTLVKIKKEQKTNFPLIELQFIAFRHNESEIKAFKKLAKELGADKATIKSAQIYQPEKSEIQPPLTSRYSRYKQDETGKFYLVSGKQKYCRRQWSGAVITWDGEMAPCCFDKNATYSYGNTKENHIYALWQNQRANMFRTNLFQQKKIPAICKECPEKL